MKFDHYLLNTYLPAADGPSDVLYQNWREQAIAADQLGYHCVWVTEHHFREFGGMLPNPQVLLGAFAMCTSRVRLGTAVVLLALHNPIRVAEDLAMLDNLSGGRLEAGFGRGMAQTDFGIFKTTAEAAQGQLEEGVGVIREAWTNPRFNWFGEHYRFEPEITVMPRVLQRPHPPIWIPANRDPEHFAWIGRCGFNLLTLPWAFPTYEQGRTLIGIYRQALREGGHDVSAHEVLGMFPAFVDTSAAAAHEDAEMGWANWRALSALETPGRVDPEYYAYHRLVAEHRAIFGDPAQCRDHVATIEAELGLDRIAMVHHFGGIPQERVLNSMRTFAEGVAV
jgi:alkanesulfonate monooxygenase SsuD/methylene tetrahydromethanopterin reductase-like flavin-dependent oxidoreductase (luciferase family)